MSRILVIGEMGFIGSRLVPELRKREHKVQVVDLNWFGPSEHFDPTLTIGDAADLTEKHFANCDVVIFLGGLSNDPMSDFDPAENFRANAATPAYLAEIAKRAGVKTFIHGGSCSVYGMTVDKCTEADHPTTTSPYGVSKLMGEIGVKQQSPFMRTVLFRMGTVAGWSPRMRFDLVVNAMVKSALTTGEIIVNDGSAKRPILDISDAVLAYVYAVEDDRVNGVINIASENTTVREIANTARFVVEGKFKNKISIKHNDVKEIRSYQVSTARAERLGIYFTGSVLSAALEVMNKFPSIENPEDDRYYNIRTFKAMAEAAAKRIAA